MYQIECLFFILKINFTKDGVQFLIGSAQGFIKCSLPAHLIGIIESKTCGYRQQAFKWQNIVIKIVNNTDGS